MVYSPRSGVAAVAWGSAETLQMICFGGVIDEEVSDEHLVGTCVNDMFVLQLGPSLNKWEQLHLTETDASFCGRFNSMMSLVPNADKLVM